MQKSGFFNRNLIWKKSKFCKMVFTIEFLPQQAFTCMLQWWRAEARFTVPPPQVVQLPRQSLVERPNATAHWRALLRMQKKNLLTAGKPHSDVSTSEAENVLNPVSDEGNCSNSDIMEGTQPVGSHDSLQSQPDLEDRGKKSNCNSCGTMCPSLTSTIEVAVSSAISDHFASFSDILRSFQESHEQLKTSISTTTDKIGNLERAVSTTAKQQEQLQSDLPKIESHGVGLEERIQTLEESTGCFSALTRNAKAERSKLTHEVREIQDAVSRSRDQHASAARMGTDGQSRITQTRTNVSQASTSRQASRSKRSGA